MSAVEEVATSPAFLPVANGMIVSRKSTSKLPPGLQTDGGKESGEDNKAFRADANSEFGENLKQALFNLKALNGQTNFTESQPIAKVSENEDILSVKPINGGDHAENDISKVREQHMQSVNKELPEKMNGDEDDDDVILLDEADPPSSTNINKDSDSEECPSKDVQKKGHPYSIGNDVRNSFKEIVSKMSTSDSNHTLTNSKPTSEKSSVSSPSVMVVDEVEMECKDVAANGKSSAGNLFENISSLKSDEKDDESDEKLEDKTEKQKPCDKLNPSASDDEVIELDDDIVEESDSKKEVCDIDTTDTEQSCDIVEVQSKGDNLISTNTNIDLNHSCDEVEKMDVSVSCSNKDKEITTIDIKSDSESEKEVEILTKDPEMEKTKAISSKSEQDCIELEQESDVKMDTSEAKCDTISDKSVKSKTDSQLKDDKELDKKEEKETFETSEKDSKCPTDSETSPGDRKRPADSLEISSEPKRSRLDMVIGKLGSQIGISPEAIKCVDEASDTEESPQESESTDKSEDATSSVTEDEESESGSRSRRKPIRLSEKELEDLVRRKVVAYLSVQKESMVAQLRKKLEDIQILYETSRTEVKELQKSVLDLTILNQKHEKRKAATAALRNITSRSIGVQVDEAKANLMSQLGTPNKTAKTPPKTGLSTPPKASPSPIVGALNAAPLSTLTSPRLSTSSTTLPTLAPNPQQQTVMIPASALSALGRTAVPTSVVAANQSVTALLQKTAVPGNNTVRSLLDTSRNGQAAASSASGTAAKTTTTPALIGQSATSGLIMVSNANTPIGRSLLASTKAGMTPTNVVQSTTIQQVVQAAAAGGATVKVIDLTGDDDSGAKQAGAFAAIPVGTVMRPAGIGATSVSQVLRQVAPIQQQVGQQVFLSAPVGTQIVKTTQASSMQTPTYQLVFNSSSPAIRAGNVLTVVSGATTQAGTLRAAAPAATTFVTAGLPVPGNTQLVRTSQTSPNITIATKPLSAATVLQSNTTQVRPPPPLQTAPVLQTLSAPSTTTVPVSVKHPAPFPAQPPNQVLPGQKALPPKPGLKISRVSQGIVLSWNMTVQDTHAEISNYQLFAYQETSTPPNCNLWKKVGDVKALPLPMACTLTQFQEGNRYHFAVRAIDGYSRVGPFSEPSTIHLTPANRA